MSHRYPSLLAVISLLALPAPALTQTVAFVAADGTDATAYHEGSTAWLRVEDAMANSMSQIVETVEVDVTTTLAMDWENVVLTETGPDTGIFMGSIELAQGDPPSQPGVLETTTTPSPFTRDNLNADYDAMATDSAQMVGSLTDFLDAWGAVTTSYAVGEVITVRVRDQLRNDPLQVDSFSIQVSSPATGDGESLTVTEIGSNTGIFTGSLPNSQGGSSGDGSL